VEVNYDLRDTRIPVSWIATVFQRDPTPGDVNSAILSTDSNTGEVDRMNTQPHRGILVGGIVIITVGFANAALTKKPVSKVLVGGIGFLLLASILDAIGGQASAFASAIVGLAVVTALLAEGVPILTYLATGKA
jgi:hypothetical protein